MAETASGGTLSLALWATLIVAAVLMLVAALPDGLTYRVSVPVGRAVGAARFPLVASALALSVGVVIGLLLSNG